MDPGTRQELKDGFDRAAGHYASSRPGYPPPAVAWLLGAGREVLDVGAGSGSLTVALAGRGARVVAAEPSRNLLAELRVASSGLPTVQTGAEALPFRAHTFDVVTVATAFHWFEPNRAVPELARVLRPGGRLSLVWNTRAGSDSGWTARLADLLRSARPSTLRGHWGVDSARVLDDSTHFEPPEQAAFEHEQLLDRAALVSLVASRSYVIALAPAARAALLTRVGALFDASVPQSGVLALPYRTECFRSVVRRVPAPAPDSSDPTRGKPR